MEDKIYITCASIQAVKSSLFRAHFSAFIWLTDKQLRNVIISFMHGFVRLPNFFGFMYNVPAFRPMLLRWTHQSRIQSNTALTKIVAAKEWPQPFLTWGEWHLIFKKKKKKAQNAIDIKELKVTSTYISNQFGWIRLAQQWPSLKISFYIYIYFQRIPMDTYTKSAKWYFPMVSTHKRLVWGVWQHEFCFSYRILKWVKSVKG